MILNHKYKMMEACDEIYNAMSLDLFLSNYWVFVTNVRVRRVSSVRAHHLSNVMSHPGHRISLKSSTAPVPGSC